MAMVFDAHDDLRSVTGVETTADLLKLPLTDLQDMREAIQDPAASKKAQPKIEYLTKTLDAAIKNHPDTLATSKEAFKNYQEAEFQRTLDAKRAKEIELTQQQSAAEREQRRATIEAAQRQEVLNALQGGPEARATFLEKQAAGKAESKPELPDEAFPGDSTSDTRTDAERQAQIARSTANARAANKAEQDRADAQAAADAERYKKEHQAAAVEDFGLQRQRASDVAEPATEAPYVPPKLSAEGPEQGVSNQVKGQGELFTPKTGEPTKAAANKAPVVAPVVAAETALKDFNKRNTKKQKTKTAEPEQTEAQPTLRESITAQRSKLKDVNDRAKAFEVDLEKTRPDLADELLNLTIESTSVDAENYNQWAKEVDDVTRAAQVHISSEKQAKAKIGAKEVKYQKDKPVPADLEKTIADAKANADVGDDVELESRKYRKEPKEAKNVEKEPTTKEALHQAVKDWFNPVWLNRAIKNGWLHIEDSIQDTNLDQGTKDKFDESKGLYFGKDGTVYLFAKNIPAGHELGVILHEIGEHKGLDNMIGKDRVTQLANRVRDMANGKKGTLDQKIATKALARIEGMKGEKADKELIAYFTEIAVNEHDMKPNGKANLASKGTLDWINTLWNSISKALEKLHFSPKDFNAQDLLNVVHGAARLEMGDMGKRAEGEDRVMESKKPQMTATEAADRKARGLTVFAPDPKQSAIQSVKTMYKTVGMIRDKLDTFGVNMVGPLFSAHRKANEYYGPDSFYTKATNKIRGTLLMQHTLNAMNFIIPSMRNGSLTIDAKGYFHQVVDKNNNIPALAKKFDAIQKAMKANGVSDAIIEQDIKTMVFADRYKSLKDKGIKTPGEFTDASYKLGKDLQLKYAKEYKEWRDMYNNIRNNKRELLVKSGLMTPKKVDEFLDRLEYLPLYRMSENEALDAVFMSSLTAATREQRLKFDTEAFAVGDPMDNIMKNEMWLYQRAMRNHTANRMADEFTEIGLGRFVKNRHANDKNVVTILKDGELAHFQIDNPNDAAVFQASPTAHGMTISVMRLAASFLRRGVTITPSFAYRQMWDDVERTWMQSGGERSFVGTLMKSASEQGKNLFKDNAQTKELEAHGVVGQVDIQDGFNRMMQHMMGTHNDTWLGKAESVLEGAERVARNSDMAARISVYDSVIAQAKKEGRTDMDVVQKEAALRAQMMINFNHKGTSGVVRTLTAMVPFINARIQSDWRLLDAVKGNIPGVSKEKAHKMLMFKVAKAATFTALYAMARSGDDD
jgi:hypothetical protein